MKAADCSWRTSMNRMPRPLTAWASDVIWRPRMPNTTSTPCAFRHSAIASAPVILSLRGVGRFGTALGEAHDLFEGGIQNRHGLIHIFASDDQGWHEPDRLGWKGVHQEAQCAAGLDHLQRYRLAQLHCQEQAAAANRLHDLPLLLQGQESLAEVAPHGRSVAG